MNIENKRLYRSRQDRVLGGVCGGLGEYLDVDPVLIRVAWVAMALVKGFGILLYIIWIFVVPLQPFVEEAARKKRHGGVAGIVFGSVLIALGLIFLADEWRWIDLHLWGGWTWDFVMPVLLMAAGVWFLLRSREQRDASTGPEDRPTGQAATARRFTREREGKKIFGVCAGIGTYLGVDATIIRMLFVVVALMHLPIGILTYLALAIFTPMEYANGHSAAGSPVR